MAEDELLLIREAVLLLRLRGPENFARFARRHGIQLVRFGARVRVRRRDINDFVLASLCTPNPTGKKEKSSEES